MQPRIVLMPIEAPRIFLVAGEPSGDTLGAGLLRALLVDAPDLQAQGIGGPGMQQLLATAPANIFKTTVGSTRIFAACLGA